MNVQALQTLFTGLIMSEITYALPAFAVQLIADDRHRLDAISRKARHRGVTCTDFDTDELIDHADCKLFAHITQPIHCFIFLLPKPMHTALTASAKDNIISCHIFNIYNTKIVL